MAVVLRGVRLTVLQQLDCGRGLDTGEGGVSETQSNALA